MKISSFILGTSLLLISTAPYAANPTGKYAYVEKGYRGSMVIKQQGPGFLFKFKTTSNANGQMCDFETYETPIDQGGGRVDDDKPANGGTKEDGIKFKITFSGNTATVDVSSKGDECGMSGYFGGKYVRSK